MGLPTSPTNVQNTIPSYLYWQYNDDADLQAFVNAYNGMAQQYVNTFNQINLPVYTGSLIANQLLDWVALGIYGQSRPVLSSGQSTDLGEYNSIPYNELEYNGIETIGPSTFYATTDDIFKRILTWNLYRGDGYTFSVKWLKRRIMRFLTGANGTDPGIEQTYPISITFSDTNVVNIRILSGYRTITSGPLDMVLLDTVPLDSFDSTFEPLPGYEYAPILKAAIDSSAVNLPFQYTYNVTI
jgi:hypothetical protein